MKKIYKILGAVAIIGLFLLSSIPSTSLAVVAGERQAARTQAQPQQPQEQKQAPGQQVPGQQQPEIPWDELPEVPYWNGWGGLPYYDGDGQDGGLFYGASYPIPEEYGLPDEYTLPFGLTGFLNKPQYVVYYIAVKRIDQSQQFKAVIANWGTPSTIPCNHAIICFKCGIPVGWDIDTKVGILIPALSVRVIESPQVGGPLSGLIGTTVMVITDVGQDVDEAFDVLGFVPRVRRFVANWICPCTSLIYPFLWDIGD